ncbi:hypothetical protein CLU79DRAFT_736312 [Phycomyces nitens]|nr:hypothetical protein CLU79DRAFT_736312 [Phycomyces nitens]
MIIYLVHELLSQNKSTSSVLSEAYLTGKIEIVSNDRYFSCPIIYLVDPETDEKVKCQVNQMNPLSNKQIVCLRHWTWTILTDGSVLVGFIWDPAYHDGLKQFIKNNALRCQDLFKENTVYRPLQLRQSKHLALLTAAGKVSAISGVYQKKMDGIPAYFVELEDQDHTLCVWFLGKELVKYYWDFVIGDYYVFSDVQVATLAINKTKRGILRYTPQSNYFWMTRSQTHVLENIAPTTKPLMNYTSVFPPAVWLKSESDGSHTRQGVITRIIDSVLGIYEIDNQYALCLFHSAYISLPYHLYTRLRLHHIHSVQLQVDNSILLDRDWKLPFSLNPLKTYAFLIACPRSRVEILSIPIYNTPSEIPLDMVPCSMTSLDQTSFEKELDFIQLLQTLEFKLTLYHNQLFKSISLSSEALLQATQNYTSVMFPSHHNEATDQNMSIFTSFLEFNQFCTAIPSSTNSNIFLQAYISIKELKAVGHRRAKDKYNLPSGAADIKQASIDDCPIICIVDTFSDGQLCVKDGTGSIPLVIIYPKDHSQDIILIGTLCIIRRFEYINEYTSLKDASRKKCTIENIYLTCHIQDIDSLYAEQSPLTAKISNPSVINPLLDHFEVETKSDFRTVLHIQSIQPTRGVFCPNNTVNLESHITAICYDVITLDSNCQATPPHLVTLILSSERESLCQLAQFHIGRWVASTYKNMDQSLWRVGSKTRNLPIATNTGNFQIIPVLGSISHFKVPKIYDIKDVLKLLEVPVMDYGDQLVRETIDLQGLVVHKEYIQKQSTLTLETRQRIFELYKTYRMGYPQITSHTIMIRLRSGLNTFCIYINPELQILPLGIIPGSVILFSGLGLRRKRNGDGIYGYATTFTYATVLESSQDIEVSVDQDIPVYKLGQCEPEQDSMFKAVCHIKVKRLYMQWMCKICGLGATADGCEGQCDDPKATFKTRATVKAYDGTADCQTFIDDEQLLFILLGSSKSQQDRIRQLIFSSGKAFSYDAWNNDREQSQVEDLCQVNNKAGRYWLYGYFHKIYNPENQLEGSSRGLRVVYLEPITNLVEYANWLMNTKT